MQLNPNGTDSVHTFFRQQFLHRDSLLSRQCAESAPPRIQATLRLLALLGLILTFTADKWKMHPSVLYLSQTLRKKL